MKKRIVLKVRDKTNLVSLNDFCKIIFTSKFINTVGIEIDDQNINKLKEEYNIISFRESREGNFESNTDNMVLC